MQRKRKSQTKGKRLTLDAEHHWLAGALALAVDGRAGVEARSVLGQALKHQGLVLDEDPLAAAMLHCVTLQRGRESRSQVQCKEDEELRRNVEEKLDEVTCACKKQRVVGYGARA